MKNLKSIVFSCGQRLSDEIEREVVIQVEVIQGLTPESWLL